MCRAVVGRSAKETERAEEEEVEEVEEDAVRFASPPVQVAAGTLGKCRTVTRAGVARVYITPSRGWRTTSRALANPGE
jgi:hypothetical protein